MTIDNETSARYRAVGGGTLLAGALTAMVGTYLLLVAVMLTARPPLLERAVGQDRLLRWHRRLAPWALLLLVAHACLVTAGELQRSPAGQVLRWTPRTRAS